MGVNRAGQMVPYKGVCGFPEAAENRHFCCCNREVNLAKPKLSKKIVSKEFTVTSLWEHYHRRRATTCLKNALQSALQSTRRIG